MNSAQNGETTKKLQVPNNIRTPNKAYVTKANSQKIRNSSVSKSTIDQHQNILIKHHCLKNHQQIKN